MTVLNTWDLSGRVALITGAGQSGGIGFATATAMASAGGTVAIADLPASNVGDILASLPGKGHSAHAVDVTNPEQTAKLVADVAAKHGRLDTLVNAAAILVVQPFLDIDLASWSRTLEINTTGTFLIAQAASRYMVEHGGGQIILIASNVGRVPRINNASYAASKAAVIHLARSMAMELGRHNVSVNALCPGSTATSMLIANQAAGDASRLDGIIKGSIEQWRTGIPLGRLADPADQAALAVFLASAGGRYISGQAICVDGAQTYFS